MNLEKVANDLAVYYDICFESGLFSDDELTYLDNIYNAVKYDNNYDVDALSDYHYISLSNGLDYDSVAILNDLIKLNYNI